MTEDTMDILKNEFPIGHNLFDPKCLFGGIVNNCCSYLLLYPLLKIPTRAGLEFESSLDFSGFGFLWINPRISKYPALIPTPSIVFILNNLFAFYVKYKSLYTRAIIHNTTQ